MVQPLQQQFGSYHGLARSEGPRMSRTALSRAVEAGEDPALIAALTRRPPTTEKETAT